jgi:hypothetical protein
MLACARVAGAECLPDTLCVVTGCDVLTTPKGDRSASANPCPHCSISSSASYDLLGLNFGATGTAFAGDLFAGMGIVIAQDTYRVSGLPAGTPLDLEFLVHVTGFMSTGGSFRRADGSVRVSESSGPSLEIAAGTSAAASLDSTATLTIPVIVGQAFTLRYSVSAGAVSGQSSFGASCSPVHLPAGALVSSCQGYSSSPVVAARRASWGAIKSRYR